MKVELECLACGALCNADAKAIGKKDVCPSCLKETYFRHIKPPPIEVVVTRVDISFGNILVLVFYVLLIVLILSIPVGLFVAVLGS